MLRICSWLLSSVQEVTLFLLVFGHPSMQFTASSLSCQALPHACWFSGLHLCSLGQVLHSPWLLWAEEICEAISGLCVWILHAVM